MSKTQITYLVMIIVFSAGLWGILRAGGRLKAAPDVAGEWDVMWDKPGAGDRMVLVQSGRFLNATLRRGDGTTRLRGTLQRDGNVKRVDLRGVSDSTVLAGVVDESGNLAGEGGRWRATRHGK